MQKMEEKEFKSRFYEDFNEENWQFQALKPYEKETNQLISIQINHDGFYQGLIESIDDYSFVFRTVGDLGIDKGLSVFKIEDVTSVKINDLECRKKFLLFKRKNN